MIDHLATAHCSSSGSGNATNPKVLLKMSKYDESNVI